MKGKGLLLGIGAGLTGVLLYTASKAVSIKDAVKKLRAANPKIHLSQAKLLSILFDVQLDIVNPSSVDIPFSYYAGNLSYNGSNLANFRYEGAANAVLKARTATTIKFQVNIVSVNLVTQLVKLITALSNQQNVASVVSIDSSVFAAGVDLPVKFSYDLKKQSVISGVGKFSLKNILHRTKKVSVNRGRSFFYRPPHVPAVTPVVQLPVYAAAQTPAPVIQSQATPQETAAQNWGGNVGRIAAVNRFDEI